MRLSRTKEKHWYHSESSITILNISQKLAFFKLKQGFYRRFKETADAKNTPPEKTACFAGGFTDLK